MILFIYIISGVIADKHIEEDNLVRNSQDSDYKDSDLEDHFVISSDEDSDITVDESGIADGQFQEDSDDGARADPANQIEAPLTDSERNNELLHAMQREEQAEHQREIDYAHEHFDSPDTGTSAPKKRPAANQSHIEFPVVKKPRDQAHGLTRDKVSILPDTSIASGSGGGSGDTNLTSDNGMSREGIQSTGGTSGGNLQSGQSAGNVKAKQHNKQCLSSYAPRRRKFVTSHKHHFVSRSPSFIGTTHCCRIPYMYRDSSMNSEHWITIQRIATHAKCVEYGATIKSIHIANQNVTVGFNETTINDDTPEVPRILIIDDTDERMQGRWVGQNDMGVIHKQCGYWQKEGMVVSDQSNALIPLLYDKPNIPGESNLNQDRMKDYTSWMYQNMTPSEAVNYTVSTKTNVEGYQAMNIPGTFNKRFPGWSMSYMEYHAMYAAIKADPIMAQGHRDILAFRNFHASPWPTYGVTVPDLKITGNGGKHHEFGIGIMPRFSSQGNFIDTTVEIVVEYYSIIEYIPLPLYPQLFRRDITPRFKVNNEHNHVSTYDVKMMQIKPPPYMPNNPPNLFFPFCTILGSRFNATNQDYLESFGFIKPFVLNCNHPVILSVPRNNTAHVATFNDGTMAGNQISSERCSYFNLAKIKHDIEGFTTVKDLKSYLLDFKTKFDNVVYLKNCDLHLSLCEEIKSDIIKYSECLTLITDIFV